MECPEQHYHGVCTGEEKHSLRLGVRRKSLKATLIHCNEVLCVMALL